MFFPYIRVCAVSFLRNSHFLPSCLVFPIRKCWLRASRLTWVLLKSRWHSSVCWNGYVSFTRLSTSVFSLFWNPVACGGRSSPAVRTRSPHPWWQGDSTNGLWCLSCDPLTCLMELCNSSFEPLKPLQVWYAVRVCVCVCVWEASGWVMSAAHQDVYSQYKLHTSYGSTSWYNQHTNTRG